MLKFLKNRHNNITPEQENLLARKGYSLKPDGTVSCATCGSNCGQCGDEMIFPSLSAFLKKYGNS